MADNQAFTNWNLCGEDGSYQNVWVVCVLIAKTTRSSDGTKCYYTWGGSKDKSASDW